MICFFFLSYEYHRELVKLIEIKAKEVCRRIGDGISDDNNEFESSEDDEVKKQRFNVRIREKARDKLNESGQQFVSAAARAQWFHLQKSIEKRMAQKALKDIGRLSTDEDEDDIISQASDDGGLAKV